jgi:cell wall-associated protease
MNHPGIFINSTLIFGNRLYTMVEKEGDFLRPLQFSVDIPENCIHMKPAKIDGIYNYLMLCRNPDGTTDFQRLPLKLQ